MGTSKYLFIERRGALVVSQPGGPETLVLAREVIPSLVRLQSAGYRLVPFEPAGHAPSATEPAGPAGSFSFVEKIFESQGVRLEPVTGNLVKDYLAPGGVDLARSRVVTSRGAGLEWAEGLGLTACLVGNGTGWSDLAGRLLKLPREGFSRRMTRETRVTAEVNLDSEREASVRTGIGYFDHMLEQIGRHGGFALTIRAFGDLHVDEHHTVEDTALVLGEALRRALGDKQGIGRYGFVLPMDEARATVAIDLSGRSYFVFQGAFPREAVGGLPTELVPHFFRSLSESLSAAIHLDVSGENAHHMVEACFKGVGRALRAAIRNTGEGHVPSTKGAL